MADATLLRTTHKPPRLYLTVRTRVSLEFMLAYVGPKCKTYAKRCPVCKAWRQFRRGQEVSILMERTVFERAAFE